MVTVNYFLETKISMPEIKYVASKLDVGLQGDYLLKLDALQMLFL